MKLTAEHAVLGGLLVAVTTAIVAPLVVRKTKEAIAAKAVEAGRAVLTDPLGSAKRALELIK